MWIGLLLFLVAAAAAVYYFRKPAAKSTGRLTLADIPAKVANPSRYTGIKSVVAWEFMAPNFSTACNFARNHDRIRMPAGDCTPLPLADCGSKTCECHYRPIIDGRKGQRRKDSDRRNSFRMENDIKAPDRRRMTDRRRENAGWDDEHLR
ncbi:hypothetical protein [Arenimonas sp. GDDSR-1]|uniref:hypothetical protein n=1 Tax=Arenimonas sp. GDDSR-1 TaxID=2950125 RepID=UPI002613F694|nr:hypothetical protein [Arenimonas sp. GDDSR-1]